MKKFLIIVSFFMLLNNVHSISASSYIVYDMDSNRVLQSNNKDNQRLIASISKIMTAIIAIENGTLEDTITADKTILKGVGSSIYIEVGESLTLKDLLYGMMLRSGNDAAIMIANYISGSEEKFTKLMNDYAKKIGMNNTKFYNASGLENSDGLGNLSSAYDMAKLTSYAFKNKTFRKIFKTKFYETKSDKKSYSWYTKNKLLKYDYITGGKTGYTQKAKRTLVTTGYVNNTNIVIVTLNDSNDWNDHLTLYKSIKDNYKKVTLLTKNKSIPNNIFLDNKIYIKNNYSLLLKNTDEVDINYVLRNKSNNNVIGKVNIYVNNQIVYTTDIYISKAKKTLFDKIKEKLL